jgi:hypothetical protein
MPTLAQQPQQQTPQVPSPRPILFDLIRGLQDPASTGRANRTDVLENFLGHFLPALANGLGAGVGAGAFGKGMAAAVGTPYAMDMARFQAQQAAQKQASDVAEQQTRTQQVQQQIQQAGEMVTLPNGMTVPLPVAKVIAPQMFAAEGRVQAAELGKEGRVEAAQIGQGIMADVPADLQQQFGVPARLPLRQLNQLESAANKPLTVVQGASGPSIANKQTGATQSLGVGNPAMGRPVQVGDVNNPGQTTFATGGQAVSQRLPGTQSASVQVPRQEAKAELPTKIGDQKVAFSTMLDHVLIPMM